jgi:hypothetical protein
MWRSLPHTHRTVTNVIIQQFGSFIPEHKIFMIQFYFCNGHQDVNGVDVEFIYHYRYFYPEMIITLKALFIFYMLIVYSDMQLRAYSYDITDCRQY